MVSEKDILPDSIFYLNNSHLFQNQIIFHYLFLIYQDDQEFFEHLHLNFQGKSPDFRLFYNRLIVSFNHLIKK